jgi:phytanoyl-CoA hydroxylase
MMTLTALLVLGGVAASEPPSGPSYCASTFKQQRKNVTLADITLPPAAPPALARQIFQDHGVLVVPGLVAAQAAKIRAAADAAFEQSLALLAEGRETLVSNDGVQVGWVTPDQTLFIPAPKGHARSKQAMVLALDYYQDASMVQAAADEAVLNVLEAITGWSNIELFGKGQCFYKEGIDSATSAGGVDESMMMGEKASRDVSNFEQRVAPGGNPKYLHQDSAYFMFAHEGAVAVLSYAVDTSGALDNGPLYVVPGSHKLGHIRHVDTPSHLGVPSNDWSFDDGVRIDGRAGDAVFFHVHTLHGSTPNRSPDARPVFINRYIEASDYQTYFATDAHMRERAEAEYVALKAAGSLPPKDRGIMLRGRREWREDGPPWKMDARVNH